MEHEASLRVMEKCCRVVSHFDPHTAYSVLLNPNGQVVVVGSG